MSVIALCPYSLFTYIFLLVQLIGDMKRITDDNSFLLSCRRSWQHYAPKAYHQSRQEQGTRIRSMVAELLKGDQGGIYSCTL